jgi:hypothetical protein
LQGDPSIEQQVLQSSPICSISGACIRSTGLHQRIPCSIRLGRIMEHRGSQAVFCVTFCTSTGIDIERLDLQKA